MVFLLILRSLLSLTAEQIYLLESKIEYISQRIMEPTGGDNAPKAEVEGAVEAARTLGIRVILVGRQEVLRRELQQYDDYRGLPVEVVNATQQVTMEDSAARAVRAKRDSSVRVASRLV